jgi:hypothetical protein
MRPPLARRQPQDLPFTQSRGNLARRVGSRLPSVTIDALTMKLARLRVHRAAETFET